MDYGSAAIQIGIMLIASIIGSVITAKIRESVMSERLNNTKKDLESFKVHVSNEFDKVRSDNSDVMASCQRNQSERTTMAMDYIRRVESSKADKSEVMLVVDTVRRVEQKIDQLMISLSNSSR